jgi:hypothetical protein
MNQKEKKDNISETIEIIENIIIFYNDGNREFHEAIQIIDNYVIFGQIQNQNEFLPFGGIPKDNIKSIKMGNKRKVFKKI